MRAIRAAASAALLGAAAVMAAGPAALAAEGDGAVTSFGFSVTPATAAPGATVTLTSEGCEVPSVTVTSGVFDTVTLEEGRPGTATVDSDARAGAQYEITFDCEGERGTATLTVIGDEPREHDGAGDTVEDTTDPADLTAPVVPVTPVAPVEPTDAESVGGHDAGTGPGTHTGAQKGVKAGYGTAASGADADGLGTAEVVTGALLIVGALGSAVVLTRRRTADGRA
ncbi:MULTISPECIES: hypothetical protein [unclassified Streptomyces]|uniref:hypothetical protein n=1 Tax=unclassified Streptomyces TaxID=2593676 RepID=UPI0006B01C45|nr:MULTISPECIES: hypothetical protein [unclassified Streptomyces]KOX25757.1 lipoprotein [Streptomyces sp. NRRL F-6491]KOX50647.1 lipoprotein [Streptomyces sp. NRRL F-6492]